jgi:anti-sigma factor RsiW
VTSMRPAAGGGRASSVAPMTCSDSLRGSAAAASAATVPAPLCAASVPITATRSASPRRSVGGFGAGQPAGGTASCGASTVLADGT